MGYRVSKEIEFDAGHRVPNHASKCRNPHGHRYRVRVTIAGELVTTPGASDEGMLADFGDLKGLLTQYVHDPLDHGFIVHEQDIVTLYSLGEADYNEDTQEFRRIDQSVAQNRFDWKVIVFPYIPTAENLARWIWEQLKKPVGEIGFDLSLVEVWETPTSLATYDG